MNIRFTPQTTKAIRKWLKENGFHTGCRLGRDMAYEPNENYIIVPRTYDEDLDIYFMKFLRKNGLKNDFDCTTLSILHELGYCETYHLFNEDEWNNDAMIKNVLSMGESDQEQFIYRYWQTETEFSANNWLIMYVKCFEHKVAELEDILWENMVVE